jgi:hypothetical protein
LSKKTRRHKTIPGQDLYFDPIRQIGTLIKGYNYYLLKVNVGSTSVATGTAVA